MSPSICSTRIASGSAPHARAGSSASGGTHASPVTVPRLKRQVGARAARAVLHDDQAHERVGRGRRIGRPRREVDRPEGQVRGLLADHVDPGPANPVEALDVPLHGPSAGAQRQRLVGEEPLADPVADLVVRAGQVVQGRERNEQPLERERAAVADPQPAEAPLRLRVGAVELLRPRRPRGPLGPVGEKRREPRFARRRPGRLHLGRRAGRRVVQIVPGAGNRNEPAQPGEQQPR